MRLWICSSHGLAWRALYRYNCCFVIRVIKRNRISVNLSVLKDIAYCWTDMVLLYSSTNIKVYNYKIKTSFFSPEVPASRCLRYDARNNYSLICLDYVATRWYRAPELLIGDLNYGKEVGFMNRYCRSIQ